MTRFALALLLLVSATALSASFSATVEVKAIRKGKPVVGAEVQVSADPRWGANTWGRFDRSEYAGRDLPEVVVEGSGTTDANGKCPVSVDVGIRGTGELPTTTVDGKEVEAAFVIVKVAADGLQTSRRAITLTAGSTQEVSAGMPDQPSINGNVKDESGEAIPNIRLGIGWSTYFGASDPRDCRVLEFESDAQGSFEFSHPDAPFGQAVLLVLDTRYAPKDGRAPSVMIGRGENDVGTLTLVKGGAVSFRPIEAGAGGVIPVNASLSGTSRVTSAAVRGLTSENGTVTVYGLLPGDYTLRLSRSGTFFPVDPVELAVKPGEVTEVGDVEIRRILNVIVKAETPEGEQVSMFRAGMTYTGSDAPAIDRRDSQQDQPYSVHGSSGYDGHVELQNLFAGPWVLRVAKHPYPTIAKELSLPVDSPINVRFEKGVPIEVTTKGDGGRSRGVGNAFAISESSESYQEFRDMSADDYKEWMSNRGSIVPVGMFRISESARVPQGRYLVIADTENGVLRKDGVSVRGDEKVVVELIPEPSRLTVTITENDRPKRNARVVLVSPSLIGDVKVEELSTGRDGVAEWTLENAGPRWILTGDEFDRLGDHAPNPRRQFSHGDVCDRWYPDRKLEVAYGMAYERTLALDDPNEIWITVDLDTPRELYVLGVSLHEQGAESGDEGPPDVPSILEGNEATFFRISKGSYLLTVYLSESTMGRHTKTFKDRIDVGDETQQTIDVKVEFNSLEVTVKAPRGIDTAGAEVEIRPPYYTPEYPDGRAIGSLSLATGQVGADGVCRFYNYEHIPDENGRCHIVATIRDGGLHGEVRCIGLKEVTVRGDTKVAVRVTNRVGALRVQTEVDANHVTTFLKDSNGNIVYPGDPWSVKGILKPIGGDRDGDYTVPGIPVGTYDVVVAVHDFLPFTQSSVRISKGEVTVIDVKPELAGTVQLKIKGLDPDVDRLTTSMRCLAEDADGNPVELYDAGYGLWGFDSGRNESTFHAYNLVPEVARLRVLFEGYEEIVVDYEFKAGVTKAEAEALKE